MITPQWDEAYLLSIGRNTRPLSYWIIALRLRQGFLRLSKKTSRQFIQWVYLFFAIYSDCDFVFSNRLAPGLQFGSTFGATRKTDYVQGLYLLKTKILILRNTSTSSHQFKFQRDHSEISDFTYQDGHAKRLRVTSTIPAEIYVIVRVSGLDALEEAAHHEPEWRMYLDPYSRGEEGVLRFFVPT
ncbi:uncharacterized protein BDR25DRAFT_315663 [Lindgomyces ingoldianus]|uniref:Uncharacterized protein n=1 Tax=Lindgomyces ingoldianus TaxID=673940 RepID=A0ACB6QQU2_9PLEO|nr:uncharacterized protein BDR25DRAFT_315663 [Lindgomyces ingoldianus]KAF2468657.1 hypothetical protein BDR25DRAFT_315663 [Lindgomyces ingoldianus]